ncbi:hypothetical protein AC1031_010692 [Aphanomyces cochlioides]|nr:hypothetical protein AC1031_010692 [Aphanomyces cochlioides]
MYVYWMGFVQSGALENVWKQYTRRWVHFAISTHLPMSDALQCKYAYKPCSNERALKKDGERHRLCAFHRDRANAVQKVYATRRRRERRRERREKLVAKLLGKIEPVPFDGRTQIQDNQAIDSEMADLLIPDSSESSGGSDAEAAAALSEGEEAYLLTETSSC